MTKQEFVVQILEQGSNTMGSYIAIQSILSGKNETLNLMVDSSVLLATISSVTPILQPFRVVTNLTTATTVAVKIVADWTDPRRRVQTGDVLTLISSLGTVTLNLLAWAEIGAGVAAGVSGLVLSADLVNEFTPYMNSLIMYGQGFLPKYLSMDPPIATETSNLYWARIGRDAQLATYDEIMSSIDNEFMCLEDSMKNGWALLPRGSCIPGSITPVDEAMYRTNYCNRRLEVEQWSDVVSGMYYCTQYER
ncbi:hypothetical protein [Paraburkholderia humisilvae]|uniref:Uncharacterized protein n=1 Tax=Paraburkholderia humisilvae TaxID=627669 RepID=A0A6J5DBB2_9BURK|nr:hypothetical protein [Paraburkholderia humisilvae]CAB3751558.1 hypothetical protein LMG29542_01495 [Paraburkholderia humisilvae]